MDWLRNGYRAKMRTTTLNSPVDVVWYRVPPGTPMFVKQTPLRSRLWAKVPENTGMGEQSDGRVCCGRFDVEWYNGAKPPGIDGGLIPCGTDAVARDGGGPDDPLFATNANGNAPCCQGPPAFVTRIGFPVGYDGTFHGNGAPPSLGQLIDYIISPGNTTGRVDSTGGDFIVNRSVLPGGSVFFQFTDLGTHWTCSLVFTVAMDFWEVETWGLRYLRVRFKRTGGSIQTMTLDWPNP